MVFYYLHFCIDAFLSCNKILIVCYLDIYLSANILTQSRVLFIKWSTMQCFRISINFRMSLKFYIKHLKVNRFSSVKHCPYRPLLLEGQMLHNVKVWGHYFNFMLLPSLPNTVRPSPTPPLHLFYDSLFFSSYRPLPTKTLLITNINFIFQEKSKNLWRNGNRKND